MQITKEQVLKVLEAHLRKRRQCAERSDVPAKDKPSPSPFQVYQLRNALESMPEVREDRIHPLEEMVRDGHYKIQDQEVAEKIIFRAAADTLIVKDE